jgi:magnesium transporter
MVTKKNLIDDEFNENGFETAKRIMTPHVPFVEIDSNLGDVQKVITKNIKDYEMISYIYILSKTAKLSGVISIKDIFRFPKKTPVEKIMKKEIVSVRGSTDQERATLLALEYNLKAIPVVDKDNNFLGVITSQVINDTLHKEGIEDTLRSAGVGRFKDPAVEIINASTYVHTKKRLPWLLVGLFGGVIAAIIVSFFENVLEAYILLAAFIPAVVYMADAVGAQSQTIFIRSMSLDKKMQIGKYSFRELKINLILGIILGLVFYFVVLIGWGFKSSFFALILGVSIFTTVLVSMAVSLVLPIFFNKINFDPAISSGPLGTAIRDLTSLMVYFGIAHFLMSRFL